MNRERHQPHADIGVEPLDRLHETDVTLLYEITHGQAIAQVAAGNVHDESQVRKHQLAGRIEVRLGAEARRERNFIVLRQDRNLRNAINIRIQAPHGARKNQTSLFSD